MARADVLIPVSVNTFFNGAGTVYVVQTLAGVRYAIYMDTGSDIAFAKSTDGGLSWSAPTIVFAGTAIGFAVWYDRWSGIAADKIHCAYTETVGSDILYRSIDTAASDALGTQTVVFAGASAVVAGSALTIWRSRGTDTIRVAGSIDAGAEDGAWSSTDAGATWGDTIADPSEAATTDQYLGLPGWNADANDEMIIFWDADADELSVKRYDDSGNTWGETSIATTMVDTLATVTFPHVAAAVDVANSRNVVVAWSRVDFATADLRCWIIDDTSITETTNVVLNSTDDQGLCAIAIDIDTNTWYVFYGGKSDGTEVWNTVKIYYKTSTDSGTTWGAETALTPVVRPIFWMACIPRFVTDFGVSWFIDDARDEMRHSALIPSGGAGETILNASWFI